MGSRNNSRGGARPCGQMFNSIMEAIDGKSALGVGPMMLVDAHTHISLPHYEQATLLANKGLWQVVTATTPTELNHVLALAHTALRIIPAFGLHPWYAFAADPSSLEPYLRQVPIIGEIGMDTIWTNVPLARQREIFIYQLEVAAELGKPVVLHTKGAEVEVLEELRRVCPSKAIVHWYSGDHQLLPAYVELGCYFTLGPDIQTNPAVQAVCRRVPLDKLLTETDGIAAVEWAQGKPCAMADVPQVLLNIINTSAQLRGVAPAEMQERVYANARDFLAGLPM